MMRTRFQYIYRFTAGLVLFLVWGIGSTAVAADVPDRFVFDLINQYRAAPYEHAVALGYEPAALAEKGIVPETRFEPYGMDEDLFLIAATANDRAASPDADQPPVVPERQRMIQTGAVLSFTSFIPFENAGTLFVRNLFVNELDTGEFKFILSSEFTYAGVAMDPGVLEGKNTWFSSLVLGSAARVSDIQILNLINQIRAKPDLIPMYISTDLLDLFQRSWQMYYLPYMKFQPVFFDDRLYDCARSEVLTPDDVEPSPDAAAGGTVSEPSVPEQGYAGEYFHTVSVTAFWENMMHASPVRDLFTALLMNEFSTWPYGAIIFSNHYKEAGPFISVTTGNQVDNTVVDPVDPMVDPVLSGTGTAALCAGSGIPADPPETPAARIYGIVFIDHDDDAAYAPGEELSGETVSVYDIHRNLVASAVSDNAGHFSVTLVPGQYWFEAWRDNSFVRRFIHLENNQFVKMGFSPMTHPTLP
jgi:hypothetical protein